ncbi:MAG: DUF1330 domain-containing protein [Sphingobium sp.]
MPAYMVVDVRYADLGWTEAYRRDVPPMIAAFGGHYLALARSPERLEGEGDSPDTLAIVEFPTADAARALLASPAYRPYAEARQAGATTRIYLLES